MGQPAFGKQPMQAPDAQGFTVGVTWLTSDTNGWGSIPRVHSIGSLRYHALDR